MSSAVPVDTITLNPLDFAYYYSDFKKTTFFKIITNACLRRVDEPIIENLNFKNNNNVFFLRLPIARDAKKYIASGVIYLLSFEF